MIADIKNEKFMSKEIEPHGVKRKKVAFVQPSMMFEYLYHNVNGTNVFSTIY